MFFSKPLLIILSLIYLSGVHAHYCFESIDQTPPWDVVRRTDNYWGRYPVESVNDLNFRCYNRAGGIAPNTYSVAAGHQITFNADSIISHIGVVNVYMAKAPGKAIDFDGAGQVWFKVFEITAHADPSGNKEPTYPATMLYSITFTIPKNVPTGEYLLRIEHIALHGAQNFGGAQFYIACAQLAVTNGGSGSPWPLVSIPGVYTGHEPGIHFNPYWPIPTNYTQPGPAVWRG